MVLDAICDRSWVSLSVNYERSCLREFVFVYIMCVCVFCKVNWNLHIGSENKLLIIICIETSSISFTNDPKLNLTI